MADDGGNKRHRAGSISGRLRTASDLEQCGLIDSNQKGVLKDMIISGDSTLQGALEKYELGDYSELEAIIKSGTLADRRSSIDLLDGLDLDFLGNSLGDSFDGFEFDSSANQFNDGGGGGEDKFRYRSDSDAGDLMEERNSLTGERIAPPPPPSSNTSGPKQTDLSSSHTNNSNNSNFMSTNSATTHRGGANTSTSANTNTANTLNTSTSSASINSQGSSTTAGSTGLSVGYDPLFSSGITYEEQRLRAGSFHTEQQQLQHRARANSLMMDQQSFYPSTQMRQGGGSGDAWQTQPRNPPYYQGGAGGSSGFHSSFGSDGGLDVFGGGDAHSMGGGFGMGGGHGGVGSFGASPDIDYGMGIYEQRLRGHSFQQVNGGDQRMRAGSFQLYPTPQQQQQQQQMAATMQQQNVLRGAAASSSSAGGGSGMMHPSGARPGSGFQSHPYPSSSSSSQHNSSVLPGEKRSMHQVDAKTLSHQQQQYQTHPSQHQQMANTHNMYHTDPSHPHHNQQGYHSSSSTSLNNGDSSNAHGQNQSLAAQGYVGTYSPEARKERISRFMDKRKNRVWTKKVKYDVRKNFADSRIRVKGRFVKKEDEEKMRLQLGEEEWARVVAKSRGEIP